MQAAGGQTLFAGTMVFNAIGKLAPHFRRRSVPERVRSANGENRQLTIYSNVLPLLRLHRRLFFSFALAGLVLRLFFVVFFPAVTDDSHIYADLATNWLQHGIYGHSDTSQPATAQKQITPTDARLPGYPAFLALVFAVFGVGNMKAVMLVQVLFDLATCLLVADLARRLISDRAADVAFVLTALCPFLANYVSAVLTETLEIFFTAFALDCAAAALDRMGGAPRVGSDEGNRSYLSLWAATGVAIGMCILLRPDGGILLGAVLLFLAILAVKSVALQAAGGDRAPSVSITQIMAAAIVVAVFALAPMGPWTIRNFRTLHHFQPLAPRYANDTDELVLRGFNRWVKTWMAEYASVEEVYWNVPGEKIEMAKLPARSTDSDDERETTSSLIDDYNDSQDVTPDLDARFEQLAEQRIRTNPARYYATLPLLRITDMWFRPRTEMLPPDVRWWEFNDDPARSTVAVGFGFLNLLYVAAAVFVVIRKSSIVRWVGLLVCFLLLRSVFLGTLENPEPRYTLECYPAIIVLAAAAFSAREKSSVGSGTLEFHSR